MHIRRVAEIDPRYFQHAALFVLLALANAWSDFGSGPLAFLCAGAGCLGIEAAAARVRGAAFDWRSPLITTCSLALLLRAPAPGWFLLAGVLAIGSKALLRWRGKHMFNPANFAIVGLLLAGAPVWISPGQWGQVAWVLGIMIGFAALVLSRARRLDIAATFIAAYALCLFGRMAWLGDPPTIPLHQLQTGALIVFTAFMITDPRSTPDARAGRIVFAGLVAVAAIALQIRFLLVGAPLYALALVSPLTPLIDTMLKASRYRWSQPGKGEHEVMA